MTARLVTRWAELTEGGGDRVAVVDERGETSFAQLGRVAGAVSAELVSRQLAGRRVAMLVTQGAGWLQAFFGVVGAGAVAVPLSPLHPEAEQKWFVEASRSEAIIVSRDMAHRVAPYADGRFVLVVEDVTPAGVVPRAPSTSVADVATILYTSGTTGKPKGALITGGNLFDLARLVGAAWEWRETDVLLHTLPLHHLHGLGISLFVSVLAGGRTRMMAKFDADRVWDALPEATVLMGVPTMHKKLLDAFDASASHRDRRASAMRKLRLLTSGSAALPATIGERLRDLSGDYPLERFGMTEIGVGMSNPLRGVRVPGTCGPALPGMEIRIVDEHGAEARPGEPGEIWIRGPTVFAGYDGLDDATRAAFSDGWFRSGDTATWTEAGYGKILGRTSVDILKSGGYKLSALEIEEVLREHPVVADVAVVGLPDETWGEIAVAAVMLRAGAAGAPDPDLRAWAKSRLAAYKVPKHVLYFDELPRNPVGKVIKPELARLVAERLG